MELTAGDVRGISLDVSTKEDLFEFKKHLNKRDNKRVKFLIDDQHLGL